MKKKLKIEQLKIQSFVTTPQSEKIVGGETKIVCAQTPDTTVLQTAFSCLAYMSCHPLDCVVGTYAVYCTTNVTTNVQVSGTDACP